MIHTTTSDIFVAMQQMPAESHEYRLQRERIVARCLPLADHVASTSAPRRKHRRPDSGCPRRIDERCHRFDPTKGPSFIGFAVPP